MDKQTIIDYIGEDVDLDKIVELDMDKDMLDVTEDLDIELFKLKYFAADENKQKEIRRMIDCYKKDTRFSSLLTVLNSNQLDFILSHYSLKALATINPANLKGPLSRSELFKEFGYKRLHKLCNKIGLAAKVDLRGEFHDFSNMVCESPNLRAVYSKSPIFVRHVRRGGYTAKKRRNTIIAERKSKHQKRLPAIEFYTESYSSE